MAFRLGRRSKWPEAFKVDSLWKQIMLESQIAECHPELPPNYLERTMSNDANTLKRLLKDLENLNMKNMTKNEKMMRKDECIKKTRVKSNSKPPCLTKYSCFLEKDKDETAVDIPRFLKDNCRFNHLEFVRIVDFVPGDSPLDYRALVEARDLGASRVPVRLNALYYLNPKTVIFDSQLHQPAPYLKINREDPGPAATGNNCKGLLYANLKGCPIIEKRLNVSKDNSINRWWDRPGLVVEVDDPRLQSMAKHAVEQRKDQKIPLQFIRLAGTAWAEYISQGTTIYHLMIVASEAGTEKTFYAAVLNGRVIDWADTTSPRATMNLPGYVFLEDCYHDFL